MLEVIEFWAVIAAGVFGVMLARRKGMDFVGVFSVALITAFGGGTLRDVLLDRRPLFWIKEPHYPLLIFALAVCSVLVRRWPQRLERWLSLPDALGLGLFSLVGAGYALEQGTTLFVASLFGVMTGTFGGVIGDIVCNDVPNLFQPSTPLYATCSFLGCWAYFGLRLCVNESVALWLGIALVVLLRFAALRWNLRLPAADGTFQ